MTIPKKNVGRLWSRLYSILTRGHFHGMEDAGSIRPANGCSMNYTAWAYTIGLEGVDRSPSGGKVRRSWYHTDFGHNRGINQW
ncbi:hypothetical protein GLOIN_2v1873570 [Rhizophagus irregularis DAOM 181602=DAOM 197198]|nr:hypothetical protein GLOIN_2v1873570 [Rhizophagus irregularis DAOM 181602=DAOM 197198]